MVWIVIVAVACVAPLRAHAVGVDAHRILQEAIGLGAADATAYWNGVSWSVAALVADGRRVAFDGLGAFEPAYARAPSGDVIRSMRFTFNLEPALEQPGMSTVFDGEFIKFLDSYKWLEAAGGKVSRRLGGDEWWRLRDVFVFCVLRNTDGHARQPLGLDLGHFYPRVALDVSTRRNPEQRRIVIDFVADDDSPAKFTWQYQFSVAGLHTLLAILGREADNLARYARVTRIVEYAEAEALVRAVAAKWQAELDDLAGSRAQDHNSSRSNNTSIILEDGTGDLGRAQAATKAAAAQDHNSSRSNNTSRALSNVGDGAAWGAEVLSTKAQDHNSSRSNNTSSVAPDFYNDLIQRYGGAYGTRAQDHNSSRSNNTSSVMPDFEPGPGLLRLFAEGAGF